MSAYDPNRIWPHLGHVGRGGGLPDRLLDVGVEQGGHRVAMTQPRLDRTDVGTQCRNLCRERVAQGVDGGVLMNSGRSDCGLPLQGRFRGRAVRDSSGAKAAMYRPGGKETPPKSEDVAGRRAAFYGVYVDSNPHLGNWSRRAAVSARAPGYRHTLLHPPYWLLQPMGIEP